MKKFLMLFAFFLTISVTYGQDIADVQQRSDRTLIAFDSENREISRMNITEYEDLSGFSSTIIVVTRKDNTVIVYNQEFREISRMNITDNERVKNVSGNNFIIKRKDGTVITYDKDCREISRRNE